MDGTEFGGAPATFTCDRYALAFFTADAGEVARRLPSPRLHPLRWFDGRAAMFVSALDVTIRIGELPPIRAAEMNVAAMVTYGRSRPLPVIPLLGVVKPPLVGGPVNNRYHPGQVYLAAFGTNRIDAEINRLLFGAPGSVRPIRQDRSPDRWRFTATDGDGTEILSLEVPAGGRAIPVDQVVHTYLVRGPTLLRLPEHETGAEALCLGRPAARLGLGRHPLADNLRALGLSTRSPAAVVSPSVTVMLDQAPHDLGLADQPPVQATAREPIMSAMTIVEEDGDEELVDQWPQRLPFDAAGTFEAQPKA